MGAAAVAAAQALPKSRSRRRLPLPRASARDEMAPAYEELPRVELDLVRLGQCQGQVNSNNLHHCCSLSLMFRPWMWGH